MKVIIAGGRDFDDYDLLKQKCNNILQNQDEVIIISGGAKGADSLGERYGKEKGYNVEVFSPKWNEYGKKAGPIRNQEMATNSNALIAFWDGKSKGTKHMIDTATDEGLLVRIIKYKRG
jgi:ribonucleotide reductase alpha subunit